MKRLIPSLVSGLLVVSSVPVAAQDDVAPAVPDPAALEALCAANALDEDVERLCLGIVRRILLRAPGSEPEDVDAQATEEPEPVVYGLGDTQEREAVRLKPIKVDWNLRPLTSWDTPGKGKKFVAVLVQYKAGEKRARYSSWDWHVRDRKGFTYPQLSAGGSADPALLSGDIKPGRRARGWLEFEVPRNTRWLELRQEPSGIGTFLSDSGPPLYWIIRKGGE